MDSTDHYTLIDKEGMDTDRSADPSHYTIDQELYSLIGGAPPVAFVKPTFHAKHNTKQKAVPWVMRSFTHSARTDDLALKHWTQRADANQEYPFAKFNRTVDVIQYTDEDYEKYLQDPNWSKDETDHLFQLCRQFDLRFPVIGDRYHAGTTPRTIEDLKDRYYSVNRILYEARSLHVGSELAYDKAKEMERKEILTALYNRSQQEVEEEEALFMEARRIQLNEYRLTRERDGLLTSLHLEQVQQAPSTPLTPSSGGPLSTPGGIGITGGTAGLSAAEIKKKRKGGQDESSMLKKARRISNASSILEEPLPEKKEKMAPGVYVRSQKLPGIKPAMQKVALALLGDLGIGPRPKMPTERVCTKYEHLQNIAVKMLELKKVVEKLEAEHKHSSGRKNSSGGGSRDKRRK